MYFYSHKHVRRIIILLDTLATTAAFLLALYLRMWSKLVPWKVELYSTIYALNVLIYLFWNTYRRAKHREDRITQMDPVENVSHVFRERIFQYAALIIILSATHSFEKVSRMVLLYAGIFDVVFTSVNRLLLRRRIRRSSQKAAKEEHYLIVTTRAQESIARARLLSGLPGNADIAGVFLLDEEHPDASDADRPAPVRGNGTDDGTRTLIGRLDAFLKKTEGPLTVYLYLPDTGEEIRKSIADALEKRRIPFRIALFSSGRCVPLQLIDSVGPYAAAAYEPLTKKCEVFGVHFMVSDVETAAFSILNELDKGTANRPAGALAGQYLCFSNVHTTVMAHDDLGYRDILNGSACTFPDGKPIAEYQKSHGFVKAERVAGPDFMDAVFRATMDGRIGHYFYGSTPETIEKLERELRRKYPGIRIAGMVSPPFRPETEEEDAETIRRINASGAALIWIGLGAPKQEKWMAAHKGKLNGVMLGVGAGFNFYAGTVKRAPLWIQKIGMEWLYRLFQDPKRLANRYLVTNARYIWYLIAERLSGHKE